MATRTLVLASRNAHKLREFDRLLAPAGISVQPMPDDVAIPPEDGDSFAVNATTKARAAAEATGRAAIADDSGIEAEALGGRPGVRSARYAGPEATDDENLRRLLAEAPPGSGLRYVCALAYVDPVEGTLHLWEGACSGTVAAAPRGDGGFGYDPAFVPMSEAGRGAQARTMAELSDAEKDEISHRGNAARAFAAWLAGP